MSITWSYGVTTTAGNRERVETLLPATLDSLSFAGFPYPRLFIDDCQTPDEYLSHGLMVTTRYPVVRTLANWILSLWELYLRDPTADRYAIFQDDFICSRNLREYLEATTLHRKSYWNLFTMPSNQGLCEKHCQGWFRSNQLGRGAVALVFTRDAVTSLLTSQHMVDKPRASGKKAFKSVDGAISQHLTNNGWVEMVHNPSLVQHTGLTSSIGNRRHPEAESFAGTDFDLLQLLG